MNVLVTGGCGVIGSWVVRELLAAGERPVVLDRRDDRSLLGPAAVEVAVETGDVRDVETVAALLRRHRIERVAHLAALMPEPAAADPYAGFSVNTGGMLAVLEAARRSGVERVVFTSSKAALGPLGEPYVHPSFAPVPAGLPLNPDDVYGTSKLCCEQMGARFAATCGLTFVVLRLASTYGPGKTVRHGKVGVLSRLVEGAVRGEAVRLPRGLQQRNDMLYCRDIAQAVIRGLGAALAGRHVFQIGSGRLAGLGEFIEAVRENCPGCQVDAGPGLDYSGLGVGHYFRFDIEPARLALGYEPRYDVRAGVADYVRVLRERT